jgi:SAM-dependent methyltransferase
MSAPRPETFDADWLRLREPVDRRARADTLARMLRRALGGRETLHVVDLGGGTGSNLRHLAPQLGGRQQWTLLDADPSLLAAAPGALIGWAQDAGHAAEQTGDGIHIDGGGFTCAVSLRQADLRADPLPVHRVDLVSGAALLDLVSRDWLRDLVAGCQARAAAALFALSYDGRIDWSPSDALDAPVRDWVNRHQRGDKGFGPALGPEAAATAAALFRAAGYEAETAASDWRLDPSHAALQQHLHAGWATAATAIAPERAADINDWLARRMDLLAARTSEVTVGHTDVLALPGREG